MAPKNIRKHAGHQETTVEATHITPVGGNGAVLLLATALVFNPCFLQPGQLSNHFGDHRQRQHVENKGPRGITEYAMRERHDAEVRSPLFKYSSGHICTSVPGYASRRNSPGYGTAITPYGGIAHFHLAMVKPKLRDTNVVVCRHCRDRNVETGQQPSVSE